LLVSNSLQQAAEERAYNLRITPVPPALLDTVLVEGKTVPRLLAGFYNRRANAFGDFLTHEEFMKWGPAETTDIVRHMRMVDVLPNANDSRGYRLVGGYQRRFRRPCPPAIYRDGVLMGTADQIDVDLVFTVESIEAVEAYGGGAGLPVEFWAGGPRECGVVAFWSRTTVEPGRSLHMEILTHLGMRVGRAGRHQ
jgi:hypothetical protein